MEEIAQFLGHDDIKTTRSVYARFSPAYLRKAAEVLILDRALTPAAPMPALAQ